jgi:hypothetical protein
MLLIAVYIDVIEQLWEQGGISPIYYKYYGENIALLLLLLFVFNTCWNYLISQRLGHLTLIQLQQQYL